MKVRTYVLLGIVALSVMSAGSDKATFTVGSNPGDIAPRIESLGNGSEFDFQNHSGRYTLLNFWAVYDAASRVRNVQLWNEVNKLSSERITMYSVSLDEKESVFAGTVKTDGLEGTNQFHDELGKSQCCIRISPYTKDYGIF
ncbi:MAG: thioredoxin family protein [Tannerellaceae bacterium]|nr:thioredoxin family protein [Tannerellaceae bacterium]